MRRIYQILFVIFIIFFILLLAYAFIDPVRATMKTTLGPPLTAAFGSVHTTIVTSYIWQHYIVPFPNQALIIGGLIWIPFFVLFLKARTRIRREVFGGAIKDAGMYPLGTKPISQTSQQPAKAAETIKKAEEPPGEPKPETQAEPAPAEG